MIRPLLASLLALALPAQAPAAEIYWGVGSTSIFLEGPIADDDAGKLRTVVAGAARDGFRPERIVLNSKGGGIDAGFQLGRVVAETELDTVVSAEGTCLNSCVTVFAHGRRKVVFPTSRLGLQAPTMVDPVSGARVHAVTVLMAMQRAYKVLGVPGTVLLKLLGAPPTPGVVVPIDAFDYAEWGVEMREVGPGALVPRDRAPLY